jgi:hypothetical protein
VEVKAIFLYVKKSLLYLFFFCLSVSVYAQNISPADLKILNRKEDTLKALAKNLIVDSLTEGRMRNDSLFIRTLVRTLQVKNSFYFPFDSVQGIAKVYAPDTTFRILSWTLNFDDYYSRQRGAIQFKTQDGSLKLVPLRDFSEFTPKPLDSVRTKDNWIGAVYYNIIKTQYNGKDYYTLFGFEDHGVRSNMKWIEVLTFNEKGQPLGLLTLRFPIGKARYNDSNLPVIIPARDVWEVARQAPQAKDVKDAAAKSTPAAPTKPAPKKP